MKAFDKIIGYSAIKRELKQISDSLKNREAYESLGVSAPRGLLLFGEPGVGKSLMASAVIKESGRKAFTCRKDKPNGDFIKKIKATFDKAAENAPSIVYLDDMDKFANGDEHHPDTEEYVTVQSCIDEVKDKEVFVLATANDIDCLPDSLIRAGRFDRRILVNAPRGEDAEKIITHYLKQKKFVDGMDAKTIARIMGGRSCAELETIINQAGMYAGFERAEAINMDHFMKACMRTIFNVPSSDEDYDGEYENYQENDFLNDSSDYLSQVVYHEAGHVVISEILSPESVTLVSAHSQGDGFGGFTVYYNDHHMTPLEWIKSRIVTALGGSAAIEQRFGIFDAGNDRDLDHAFEQTRDLVVNNCICGLHLHNNKYEDSQRLWSEQEQAVSAEVEKFYRKAKEIISLNKEFLEKVAVSLATKGFLSAVDIKQIKDKCEVISIAI